MTAPSITSHTVPQPARHADGPGGGCPTRPEAVPSRRARQGSVCAMASRARGSRSGPREDAEYDWLYGRSDRRRGGAGRPPARPRADPGDARRSNRPGAGPARRRGRSAAGPRRRDRPRSLAATAAPGRPPPPTPGRRRGRLGLGQAGAPAALAAVPRRRPDLGLVQDRQGRRRPRRRPPGRPARHDLPAGGLRQPRGPVREERRSSARARPRVSAPTRSCCCTPAPGRTCCSRCPATRPSRSPATAPRRSTPPSPTAARSCWSRPWSTNTGIGIDDYVEIGFGGFVNVVDAVGGVEICPEEAMEDPSRQARHRAGLPGGRRRRPRSATPAPGTTPRSATSTAPSTSARWSARSAARPPRRGPSLNPLRYFRPRLGRRRLAARRRGHRPVRRRCASPGR